MGKSKHKSNGSSKLIKNVKVVHSAPATASSDKIKKRVHPSTKALREIKKYQKSTNLVIPKQSFEHVLRWIVQDIKSGTRIERSAIECLQECLEGHVTTQFENINLCCIHRKGRMIMPKDFNLQKNILQNHEPWEREYNNKG